MSSAAGAGGGDAAPRASATGPRTRLCAGLPREPLAHLPTPLEAAPRLSAALGVRVLIKREDLAGLCAGGNKVRLLEFVLGALRARGVDTLVASAAAQSNKLREVAAAAARCGMHAVLLLPPQPQAQAPQGNRLLFDLLGAEVRTLPPGADAPAVLAAQQAVARALEDAGRHPAVLDRHLDYGVEATLAYVDAAEELAEQLRALAAPARHVYITAGAGMTTAGLALGLRALDHDARVTGVCVSTPAAALREQVLHHAQRAAVRLGLGTCLRAADVDLDDSVLAPGYGLVTAAVRETVAEVARLHGMVLDPVYNAKTAMALLRAVRAGSIAPGETVVLVNTGGAPATFAHAAELAGAGRADPGGARPG